MRGYLPLWILNSENQDLHEELMIVDGIPELIAQRLIRQNILWLLCLHSENLEQFPYTILDNYLSFDDLDILELCALWYHLPIWKDFNRFSWKNRLKDHLDFLICMEKTGEIEREFIRNSVYLVSLRYLLILSYHLLVRANSPLSLPSSLPPFLPHRSLVFSSLLK